MTHDAGTPSLVPAANGSHWRRYRVLYLLMAVCAAPVVASYLAYYVFPPSGRTNYGDLIEQRALSSLTARSLDGTAFDLRTLRGRWVMVTIDSGGCDADCRDRLWIVRQLRLATGRDADRIERVVLLSESAPLDPGVMRAHDGARFLHVDRAQLVQWFEPAAGARIEDHVYLIDPIGNLMLRWPARPDPQRMKKDLARLLKASQVG